jgi:hypothetical protein
MPLSPRNIRKRNKTRFHELRLSRMKRSGGQHRRTGDNQRRLRQPAIFALRYQRAQSREARLALSDGQRLPPYICIQRRARRPAADAAPASRVTLVPAWPSVNPELELVDRLLAQVREFGHDAPDLPAPGGSVQPLAEAALPEAMVALAAQPSAPPDEPENVVVPIHEATARTQRQYVTTRALEEMIADEVRAQPGCDAFVAVLLERVRPASAGDSNWDLLGLRFGRADRKTVNEALAPIVARLKTEFGMLDEVSSEP